MRYASYVLYRYAIFDGADDLVEHERHRKIVRSARGEGAPYRSRDPGAGDLNNYIMRYKSKTIEGEKASVFDVGYKIASRVENRWDETTDEFDLVKTTANDVVFTRVILIPKLGLAAVKDGSGDRLPARSGIGRTRSIIEFVTDYTFDYAKTAEFDDVERAMKLYRVVEFDFKVRPFNPHPKNPGDRLHELMQIAKVGSLRGHAEPSAAGGMKKEEEGLLDEVVGLSKSGYGRFNLKAETNTGAKIAFGQTRFTGDREKDEAASQRPRELKVSVPRDDVESREEAQVVKVIKELFGGG
ncbi:MAG: hypothetical protein CMH88_15615 [Oceanibulbus sp.]|jgi:hypothetical protein|uniref:hypothetical protein n=1 Tax=Qipengyuania citrea TaxID=225971 RepID=UPI000C6A7CD3|nr:hypothetical protein [Qipengyuania citrea]MBM07751.1 hypothetical protein [Sulfitobacter sp.]HBC14316.1 hypothetical protein [Erythrobacter sp.]